ncbi:MAG: DUF2628 domain-containing protein [Pseudomonadota bacterium]|nr:DUF2628 domain-containing protein [Pseudomonadota bacterium]
MNHRRACYNPPGPHLPVPLMHVYTVHIDPLSVAPDGDAVLVREGFSWPAALLTVLWALYHGLWDWALVLAAAALAVAGFAALTGLDEVGQAVLHLGYMAVVGYLANDWRRWSLGRRGHRLADVVTGADLSAAERRYLDRAPVLVT